MAINSNTAVNTGVSQSLLDNVNTRSGQTSTTQDAKSQFLTLLTTQLRNQDPTNPMDNAQMTSQLAQLNQVDGINQLNATMQKLLDSFTSRTTVDATAMIGKVVLVPGNTTTLYGGRADAGFVLTSPADSVDIKVYDAGGREVQTLSLGKQDAGQHAFVWDGTTSNGTPAADGEYSFKITALQGGNKVENKALQYGLVSSVVKDAVGSTQLDLGKLGRVGMTDVYGILSPSTTATSGSGSASAAPSSSDTSGS